jgi:co-chaperonin GroES (HSP10)
MLKKEQIQKKLEEIKTQTSLLSLNEHRALGDAVVVVPATIDQAGVTKRSVQFEDRPDIGVVVSVGNDVEEISVGDIVFFGQYSHFQVTHDDITYLIMRQEDIYCVAN